MIVATYRVESGGPNEDRVIVRQRNNKTLVILCDGAGNGGRGGFSADSAIAELSRLWDAGFVDWVRAMLAVDQMLVRDAQGGETTCIAVDVSNDGLCRGASVGDSSAWMNSRSGTLRDLTAGQDRCRLGSGRAHPIMFRSQLMGKLLLASDGLIKYVSPSDIRRNISHGVDALIDGARLTGGVLQDDVAVILLE